ncbi:MAG: hypothetical protein RLZZ387_858 [Chloroflexota bacterium]|jgi:uncharacterized protein (UPF0548 family)
MLLLSAPSDSQIRNVLAAQRALPFSYSEVGASDVAPPLGYAVDRNRVLLGEGRAVYERARAALLAWRHIPGGWMRLLWPDVPVETGAAVAILVGLPGVWALSVCRVAYVIDEGGAAPRCGFAWGTLPAHVARGEERFTVELREDGSVWYEILAFSQPNHPLLRLGYPVMRLMQRRFARDSKRAMVRAVAEG